MAPPQAVSRQSSTPSSEDLEAIGSADPRQLSLPELTRIMDVASTLRKEQELVEEQLNIDQLKARLREGLLDAAKVSGEPLTAEQIDTAIENYYDKLHSFQEPKWSFSVLLAHLYVRRMTILKWVTAILAVWALTWGLLVSGILPGAARTQQEIERLTAAIDQRAAAVRVLSSDEVVESDLAKLMASAKNYRNSQQTDKLDDILAEVTSLQQQLEDQYTVEIVNKRGQQSGIDRYYTDDSGKRVSGYYLIVEAVDAAGKPHQVSIRNRETGTTKLVSRWAELVPREVYERVAADKQADGVIDDHVFATKGKGNLELQINMLDPAGKPVERQGQITSW